MPANSIPYNKNPVGYSRVEIIESGNGKTVENYKNAIPSLPTRSDYVYQSPAFFLDSSPASANLILREIYNEQGSIVTKDSLCYTTTQTRSFPHYSGYKYYHQIDECTVSNAIASYHVFKSMIFSYENVLSCKKHSEKIGNTYIASENTYTYNPTTWQLDNESTTNSKGATLLKVYSYPNNIYSPPYFQMASANILGTVIKQTQSVDGVQVGGFNSIYKNSTTPPFLLDRVQKWSSNSFLDQIVFDQYDYTNGNILQYTAKDGMTTSLIYGYSNQSYPVAEVKNALKSDIAYTSFEPDGDGNWTIASTARNNESVTGFYSYNGSSGTIYKSGLTNAKTYILSFWAKTGGSIPTTSTGTPIAGQSKNGWTYYNLSFTGASSIIINGAGIIDELRLYPKGSLMTTYTYKPGIGISCRVDPNNVITYYTYDSFGRLSFVKDNNGDVVNGYQYNFRTPN